MKIRVGVEGGRKAILQRCRDLSAPILVSANSLWDNQTKRFGSFAAYDGFDCALDSGGFVAMKRYGGYRWSVAQYVDLAKRMRPQWWAQMDFCCEPEIAADSSAVFKRIDRTAEHLEFCRDAAREVGTAMPMPVLQGWKPTDYCQGPIYQWDAWPSLVGIGSVCRRHVNGPTGILAVIDALDRAVPNHVRFHLFGIKGTAIKKLMEHFPERMESMDSMAWNMQARWDAYHAGLRRNRHTDANCLEAWYERQTDHSQIQQLNLFST